MKRMIRYLLLIFFAELGWSWLADMSIVHMVGQNPWEAVVCNVGSQIIAFEVLRVIAKEQWSRIYIYTAVLGSTVGTFLVSIR